MSGLAINESVLNNKDLLGVIFSFLDKKSLASAESVSKFWNRVASSIWRLIYFRDWENSEMGEPLPTWKEQYKRQNLIDSKFLSNQAQVTTIKSDSLPRCLHASNGELYSSCADNIIRVWNIKGATLVKTKACANAMLALCTSEEKVFSSAWDKTIYVCKIETGEPLQSLAGHEDAVYSLCIEGNQLFSGSADKTIRVWDVETGAHQKTLIGHEQAVQSLCTLAGKLFSGSRDSKIRVWSIRTGAPLEIIEVGQGGIWSLCATMGKLFVLNADVIHGRDIRTGKIFQINEEVGRKVNLYAKQGKLFVCTLEQNIQILDYT
jgi:WD40 repeat protein